MENEFIFPCKNGKPLGNIRKTFETARGRAKINDLHFQDLRHTFASHLVMNGVNLRTVQHLLSHKDIKMTTRSAHLSKEHIRDAVEILSKEVFGIGTNMTQNDV